MKRIALINSVLACNDAISAFVRDTCFFLASNPDYEVSVFSYRNDFSGDVSTQLVRNTAELLFHPEFLQADLIIWHFGIYYDLFNALFFGNGHAPQIVCFHNVTPKQFLPEKAWPIIDLSLRQCHHLKHADEVWAVSGTNADFARALGVDASRLRIIPLPVEAPPLHSLVEKERGQCELLYVGRFVQSKGALDLVEAVARLPRSRRAVIRLMLAGNVEFSDPVYVNEVRRAIAVLGLAETTVWHGTVDDPTLYQLYRRAHLLVVPSYHEGFGKPVVEALRAGCIPVAYDGYNLPEIVNGLGRIVPTSDRAALAAAIEELAAGLDRALADEDRVSLPLTRGLMSVNQFNRERLIYVQRFTSARIEGDIRARVAAHLGSLVST